MNFGIYINLVVRQNTAAILGNKLHDIVSVISAKFLLDKFNRVNTKISILAVTIATIYLSIWTIDIFGYAGSIFEIMCAYISSFILSWMAIQYTGVVIMLQTTTEMINSKFEDLQARLNVTDLKKTNVPITIFNFLLPVTWIAIRETRNSFFW